MKASSHFLVVVLVMLSCSGRPKIPDNGPDSMESTAHVDSVVVNEPPIQELHVLLEDEKECYIFEAALDTATSCTLATMLDCKAVVRYVTKNAKRVIKSTRKNNDDCVLGLLDSLVLKITQRPQDQFFIALDSISVVSDGYVSEYFDQVCERLVIQSFDSYMHFLYTHRRDNWRFRRCLIESLSMEANMAKDNDGWTTEMEQYIRQNMYGPTISEQERTYIEQILEEIDPDMFD